jgi:uncharacterized protein
MEYKQFPMDIKAEAEDADFVFIKGMVSPYDGKADLGGDIIEKGAYERTMYQKGDKRVMLYIHNQKEPIGTATIENTNEGLMLKEGKIAKGVQRGKETGILIGMGAMKGLSIGYNAVKTAFSGGNRILKEIALHEVSPVVFPMNEGSTINGIKSQIVGGNFNDTLIYLLATIESATKEDVEIIEKAIGSFNNLLVKVKESDPSCLDKLKLDEALIKQAEEKVILEFKNYIKKELK